MTSNVFKAKRFVYCDVVIVLGRLKTQDPMKICVTNEICNIYWYIEISTRIIKSWLIFFKFFWVKKCYVLYLLERCCVRSMSSYDSFYDIIHLFAQCFYIFVTLFFFYVLCRTELINTSLMQEGNICWKLWHP